MILSWTLQCGSLISALVFILNVFIGTTTAQYHHRPNDHLSVFPRHLDLTGHQYRHEREYSPKLARIYRRYLDRGAPLSPQCYSTDLDGDQSTRSITESDMNAAAAYANSQIEQYDDAVQQYLATDPSGLNFSVDISRSHRQARYNEFVTQYLVNSTCINKYTAAIILPTIPPPKGPNYNPEFCSLDSFTSSADYDRCDPHYPYSLLNGQCNNLHNSQWGSNFYCHRRLLPPDFGDGVDTPRRAINGDPLPSERTITTKLMPDISVPDLRLSKLHMGWGQFLAHDIYRTIQNLGLSIQCCPNTTAHPECSAITNFAPDKGTIQFNNTDCISGVRSIACNTCHLGPREQLNVATHVLDVSNLYGGNILSGANRLRAFRGGLLQSSTDLTGNETLPVRQLPEDQDRLDLSSCNEPLDKPELTCYATGDGIRGNQQPSINSLHVITHTRHNMHASALAKVNPHWDDERLFQEARRILIAESVHIHYAEYIPSIMGKTLMKFFDLNVKHHGFTKYDPTVDPSSIQAVGVAAFRMGHSQVFSQFDVLNKDRPSYSFLLRNKYFQMSDIWQGNANGILRGMLKGPSQAVDPFVVVDAKDFLFFNPRSKVLLDLAAVDINRAREHAVPGYVYYLEYCTGVRITSWLGLTKFITIKRIRLLKTIYRDYRDIDLFVGGLYESKAFGSIFGPTFACLNGIQFYHWKFGDRFYFEHGGQAGSFNIDQLNNIRQTLTLANLLCKTTDLVSTQEKPLLEESEDNPAVYCATLPELDYELWREYGPFKK